MNSYALDRRNWGTKFFWVAATGEGCLLAPLDEDQATVSNLEQNRPVLACVSEAI
jgi:hypothetical protein